MKRRHFIGSALCLVAQPALAQQGSIESLVGAPVLSNDGVNVGATRSRGRVNGETLRLFVRRTRGSLFRRIDEDVIIDVPLGDVRLTKNGIILPATAQTLRNSLRYDARLNDAGRIRLR